MSAPTAADTPILDCLGKACPVPVIELAKAVAAMDAGDEIVVLSDDPGAKVDIPVWCRMKQQTLVGVQSDGAVFRFTVRKAG
jgi:TusA-related sulfurtransferase